MNTNHNYNRDVILLVLGTIGLCIFTALLLQLPMGW